MEVAEADQQADAGRMWSASFAAVAALCCTWSAA
jgi:hypothetical protein